MTRYLSLEDVLLIGAAAFGGPVAARDLGLLGSACHRPATTAFGVDAYPSVLEKVAAMLH